MTSPRELIRRREKAVEARNIAQLNLQYWQRKLKHAEETICILGRGIAACHRRKEHDNDAYDH